MPVDKIQNARYEVRCDRCGKRSEYDEPDAYQPHDKIMRELGYYNVIGRFAVDGADFAYVHVNTILCENCVETVKQKIKAAVTFESGKD